MILSNEFNCKIMHAGWKCFCNPFLVFYKELWLKQCTQQFPSFHWHLKSIFRGIFSPSNSVGVSLFISIPHTSKNGNLYSDTTTYRSMLSSPQWQHQLEKVGYLSIMEGWEHYKAVWEHYKAVVTSKGMHIESDVFLPYMLEGKLHIITECASFCLLNK